MKTLILGLGNDLFGDDGVGNHVVRLLQQQRDRGEETAGCLRGTELLECSLTGLKLLDVLEGFDRVILIDTIKRDRPKTGRITYLREKDLRHIPGPSPHYVSIPQALAIGRHSGMHVPDRIDVIAVEAKDLYRMGEGLTQEMTDAIPEIIATLKGLLEGQ
jgi:hydrogenase maturation protease